MDTNISDKKYVSSFKRAAAISVDIFIVGFARIIFAQLLGMLVINKMIIDFIQEFQAYFGTETIKNNPDHIGFILNHKIFYVILCFYFAILMIGALYHAYFNSSKWQATIGKRMMKIMLVSKDGQKITFMRALAHYVLSILPIIYIIYLLGYQASHKASFFQAITASEASVFFGFVFLLWVQIQSFTKQKTTAYDIICKTIVIEGKSGSKFPWK